MSDSYQAIYDAVRSKIGGANISDVVADIAHRAFDISHAVYAVRDDFIATACEARRPSVLFRPTLIRDGSHWCALYGENIQEGVAGFGVTPAEAMEAFDNEWRNPIVMPPMEAHR